MRFEQLSKFLETKKLPKIIWLSEDATSITGRVQYCSKADSIVGFVGPLDSKTGFPSRNNFPATSASEIQSYFKTLDRANYVYATVAKCPVDRSPSFCLNVFGTNNKFTYEHVLQRWKYLNSEAMKYGIKILGFSSDGDPRLLKAMRLKMSLTNSSDENWNWFHTTLSKGNDIQEICVQDTVHIITKLKTRLLKKDNIIVLGNFYATVTDLEKIVSTYSKDKHLLVESDLRADDKMNYRSAEKISSQYVIDLLKTENYHGTACYLTLMKYMIQAFIDKSCTVEDRIYYNWYCIFFLRIWRYWLKTGDFSVSTNFITLNCYLCIELNGHALINLNNIFRESSVLEPEMFTPWQFSSQPCEQLFRATRSMTTTFSTVVNFSLLEIFNRIKKIEFLNKTVDELSNQFIFPREKKSTKQGRNIPTKNKFLSNEEIEATIQKALEDAKDRLKFLGIQTDNDEAFKDIIHVKFNENVDNSEDYAEKNEENLVLNVDEDEEEIFSDMQGARDLMCNEIENETLSDLENDGEVNEEINKNVLNDFGDFLNMKCTDHKTNSNSILKCEINGKTVTIKKSSLCWLLDGQKNKLSSDRLLRVRSFQTSKRNIEKSALKLEQYYAVFYFEKWFIGRILESVSTNSFKVKFLEDSLGYFHWPKKDDVAIVDVQFIFFGPIQMIGTYPFQISEEVRQKICTKYKDLKRNGL